MKKRIIWIVAVVVTAFSLSLTAVAQQNQGGRGQGQGLFFGSGSSSAVQLLANAEVVKMLELTEDQTKALANAAPQRQREQGGQGQASGGQNRTGGRAQTNPTNMRARTDETWANIGKILKADQLAKYQIIYFQAANGLKGTSLDARTLAVLGLTDEQVKKINEIADKRAEENGAARSRRQPADNAAPTPEERAAATERNRKYADQITAVLTEEQKKMGEELTAGAPALREKLGLQTQRQRGQGSGGRQSGGGIL